MVQLPPTLGSDVDTPALNREQLTSRRAELVAWNDRIVMTRSPSGVTLRLHAGTRHVPIRMEGWRWPPYSLTGLTWMFLFILLFLSVASCAAVRKLSGNGVEVSGVSRFAKGLGLADS